MKLEVEIKSLLGNRKEADIFREKLHHDYPDLRLVYQGKSINHYFLNPPDFSLFLNKINYIFSEESLNDLINIVSQGKNISVRTRETDSAVLLVVKAAVDDTTSSNGLARMEFEKPVSISLDDLDNFLLKCGFAYQAKWSREREQYEAGGFNVCLDKNAGYGYLVEFELMVDDINTTNEAKEKLRKEIARFGLVELDQERLARMFDYYNNNWPNYYGTDKVFNIE